MTETKKEVVVNGSTDQPITSPQPQPPVEDLSTIDLSDKNRALLVLVNAAKMAQAKGIFTLEEAELVSRAIKAFIVPEPAGPASVSRP